VTPREPAGGHTRTGKRLLLCADIGGTKTLLGLANDDGLQAERRYANADFQDFAGVLAAFLADTQTDPAQVDGGCLAVAGPIADDGLTWRVASDCAPCTWPTILRRPRLAQ
jgi:glucokinase